MIVILSKSDSENLIHVTNQNLFPKLCIVLCVFKLHKFVPRFEDKSFVKGGESVMPMAYGCSLPYFGNVNNLCFKSLHD